MPPCFDESKLEPLSIDGIAWFDEVHKKCFVEQRRFPRDENGKYDPEGEYREERKIFKMKFPKEAPPVPSKTAGSIRSLA